MRWLSSPGCRIAASSSPSPLTTQYADPSLARSPTTSGPPDQRSGRRGTKASHPKITQHSPRAAHISWSADANEDLPALDEPLSTTTRPVDPRCAISGVLHRAVTRQRLRCLDDRTPLNPGLEGCGDPIDRGIPPG